MLHAVGYWRPTLAAFPEAPASINTPKMQELRKTDPAQYDKIAAESRKAIGRLHARVRASTTRKRSRRSTSSAPTTT